MTEKIFAYAELIRLNRPIGIYLLLWPTLWALWFAAEGMPPFRLLVIFTLGVILMRSAGCAINDFADRDIDPHVDRTRNRPIASGRISAKEGLAVFATLSLSAFSLVFFLNSLTLLFALIAALLAASYPYMKRFHALPQVHLGAAFGWSVPMAFTATTGGFPPAAAWILFLSNLLWTTAYDTIYAISDREDDLKIGVKSSAILFGKYDRAIIAGLQILAILGLSYVGWHFGRGIYFALGLIAAALLVARQQCAIADRDASACQLAFRQNNYFGMAVFVGLALDYALET